MKIDNPFDLASLCDAMRSRGVRSFTVDGIHVEFGSDAASAPTLKPDDDVEKCNCKCPVYAHVNGLCANGCEMEICAGPEKKPDA